MAYEIESDIPIPESGRRMYPFADMSVGDSFKAHPRKGDVENFGLAEAMKRLRGSLVSSSTNYGKRNGVRFSLRTIDDHTMRCWRAE